MFCSKCGKTIPAGAETCPSCGKTVGDAHFAYSNYTSAQSIIVPGQNEYESVPVNNYTRTSYTSAPEDARRKEEADSRTNYRPVYEDPAAAEVREEMRAAAEESRERVSRRDEEAIREVERRANATRRQVDRVRSEEEELDVTSILDDSEPAYTEEDTTPAEEPAEVIEPSVPEEEDDGPIDLEGLSEETLEKIDEVNASLELEEEELDMSQFKARPIEARGRAGISADVSDYIRQLEEGQTRKARRKAAEPVEPEIEDIDDLEEVIPVEEPVKPAPRKAPVQKKAPAEEKPEEPVVAEEPEEDAEPIDENYEDLYDETGYDEDDYEDDRPSPLGTIIKIVIAVIVVAALAFGVIRYVGYIRSNQSSAPIEGVSESFYDGAVEMIESHSTDAYKNQLISSYNTNGLLGISTSLESDTNALKALMPAEPAANDATFMQAISKIQENIGSAVLMDAIAGEAPGSSSESAARWQVINNSITQLKSASSAAELTAIINSETITVSNETPAPTEEPIVYTSLQKGDENNDVLQLQVRLYTLGYLDGDRDGAFGSKTQTAIKLFQKAAGLEETGIADSNTQALLYADEAPYAPGVTTPTPKPEVTETPVPVEEPAEESAEASDGTEAA